jgi:hypothetical protein
MTRRLGLLVAVVLTIAACGGTVPGSATPDPAIAFCDALDAYGLKLAALDGLTPAATVDENKQAVVEAKAALAALIAVSGPFVGAQLNELQTAQVNLTAAADSLPASANAAQAEDILQPYLTAVIQQVAGVHNATCNTRPTPSSAP